MNPSSDSASSRQPRDPTRDLATITTRIRAFMGRQPTPPAAQGGAPKAERHTGPYRVPELDAADLTVHRLDQAIAEHGALIVRGLFDDAFAHQYTAVIDRLMDASEGITTEVAEYCPPDVLREVMTPAELANGREFRRNSGCMLAVEAPGVAEDLLHIYERRGLRDLLAAHLGEAPCVSVKKWVLRRSKLPVSEAGWHQDGAFMGTDIKSINLWIPLTHCGADSGAPGMDLVPRRLHHIVSSSGAQFDWSVSDGLVGSELADSPPVAPEFAPGDALFFDHLYLHRTQFRTDFNRIRYAIETWFFGSNSFARNQVPMAW